MGIDDKHFDFTPGQSGELHVPKADACWHRGIVLEVYPDTHTLKVDLKIAPGKNKPIEVPIMPRVYDLESQAKEILLYKRGTPVFITQAPGYWICVGIANAPRSSYPTKGYQRKITNTFEFGGDDPIYKHDDAKNPYRGQSPADSVPGDWGVMGSEGNFLGVLEGGLSIFKGGELSQIIASKLGDMIKVIARNFQIFSDFGEVKMVNDNGLTSLVINGYNSAINANKNSGNWDYTLKIGGQNLFEMRLGKGKSGDSLFSFIVDPDGKANVRTDSTFVVEMNQAPKVKIQGDQTLETKGHSSETIKRNKFSYIKGTETKDVSGQRKVFVSNNQTHNIGGGQLDIIGGTKEEKVGGISPIDLTVTGRKVSVASGNSLLDVGNPLDLGIPNPLLAGNLGSIQNQTWMGNIENTVQIKGDIKNSTVLGNFTVNAGIGQLKITPDGKVAMGTPAVEVVDILFQTLGLLSTCTAAGFGTPISIVSQCAALQLQLATIKGSLL